MISKSFENLIYDILLQSDITISMKNSGGICEAKCKQIWNLESEINGLQ